MKSKSHYIKLLSFVGFIRSFLPYCYDDIFNISIPACCKRINNGLNFNNVKNFPCTAPIKENNIVRTHKRAY